MFVSAKYTRSTKPGDAMYVWLENVNSGSFEVCIREFLPFDGKHQHTVVVGEILLVYNLEILNKIKLGMKILVMIECTAIIVHVTSVSQHIALCHSSLC